MKYIDEFRNSAVAKKPIEQIHAAVKPEINYRLMEFCGGTYSCNSPLRNQSATT